MLRPRRGMRDVGTDCSGGVELYSSAAELRKIVKEMAIRLYEERGIVTECEECFYLTDPKCPDFPHKCALEEALKNPEEREWVLEHLADKIEMRRRFKKKIEQKDSSRV